MNRMVQMPELLTIYDSHGTDTSSTIKIVHSIDASITINESHGTNARITVNESHGTDARLTRNTPKVKFLRYQHKCISSLLLFKMLRRMSCNPNLK